MSKNEVKNNFTDEEKEKFIVVSASIILSFICIVTAVLMLPQYCSLFSNNIENGFLCDGLRDWNVEPCPICEDKRMAIVASFVCGLGLGFLFLPTVIYALKISLNRPVKQMNLFG